MNESLWTEYENFVRNSGVTKKRIEKLRTMFKAVNRGLNKKLNKVSRKEMEIFITKISKDQFKKENGKPYSGNSKSDIKKFLRQYYKYLLGNNEVYPEQVNWIKTKIPKDEKPEEKTVISIKEAEKLANSFNNQEMKILTLLLFDSGFRISEMLSVEKKDLMWEEFDEGKNCWWINCNESKTYTRKIPLTLFTEEVNDFVNSSYYRGLKSNQKLFSLSYSAIGHGIRRNAEKVLEKKITPHSLRHSSATYYSMQYNGDSMLIGQRYGWSFSSKELATYIRRSGAYQKQGAKKSYSNEIVKLKEEMSELQKQMSQMQKQISKFTIKNYKK